MKYQMIWEDGDVVKHVSYAGTVSIYVRAGGTWMKMLVSTGTLYENYITDEQMSSRVDTSTYSDSWKVME